MQKVKEKYETSETPHEDSYSLLSNGEVSCIEESFEVLETSPHESERQLPSNILELQSSDLSEEEARKNLKKVTKLSRDLMAVMNQNNRSWKEILQTWQKQLQEDKLKVLEIFTKVKRFVDRKQGRDREVQLEAENSELKKKVAELEQRLAASSAKGERTEGSTSNKKELQLSRLVEQLNRQLETVEGSKLELKVNNEYLNAEKTRLEKERDNLQADIKQHKDKCHELELERKELLIKSNHVDNLTQQLESKQTAVIQQKQQIAEQTNAIETLKQKTEKLKEKNEELKQQSVEFAVLKAQVTQNSNYHELRVHDYVQKVDNLTAQLVSKEAALLQSKQEFAELNRSAKKLKKENEELHVLKAQVEVYQSDFNDKQKLTDHLKKSKGN